VSRFIVVCRSRYRNILTVAPLWYHWERYLMCLKSVLVLRVTIRSQGISTRWRNKSQDGSATFNTQSIILFTVY
jgi:hypothetical protein